MNRVLGQDVAIEVIEDGRATSTITEVTSFTFNDKIAITEASYLGDETNRHGQVYTGTQGSFTCHLTHIGALELRDRLVDKAKREVADFAINVVCTVKAHDAGETYRLQFLDIQIENPTIDVGSREDFVSFSANFSCDNTDRVD
jgi:hypothetical protein